MHILGPCGCPSSALSSDTWSYSCCHSPHRFLQPEVLRLYFPVLESWVVLSVSLPSCYSWFTHTHMWDCLVLQPPSCHVSSLPQLPFSAPLTSLDECFLFKSLVFRVSYSSIFWQFWMCFGFKLVVVLLAVRGSKVYLSMPPSWPD